MSASLTIVVTSDAVFAEALSCHEVGDFEQVRTVMECGEVAAMLSLDRDAICAVVVDLDSAPHAASFVTAYGEMAEPKPTLFCATEHDPRFQAATESQCTSCVWLRKPVCHGASLQALHHATRCAPFSGLELGIGSGPSGARDLPTKLPVPLWKQS